jgi:hypothetical protein
MGLNTNDQWYRAEDQPPTIMAMRDPLCAAYGVSHENFGCKGNENHTSGYHRSLNWVLHSPDSARGSEDYSVQLGADRTPVDHPDDCSAFDFTPGVWGTTDNRNKMKVITSRLITACQSHDPRVANVREVAGTLNGTSVVTWDCSRNAFKSPFDSSHLDHCHGSIYRSRTRWSQAGIVAVMLGQPIAPPASIGESMLITVVNPIPAGTTSINGLSVGNLARGICTPNGFFAMNSANVDQIPSAFWANTAELNWAEVQALCAALAPPVAAANPADVATVVAGLESPGGQAAIQSAVRYEESH